MDLKQRVATTTKMTVTLYLSPWLSKLKSNANQWMKKKKKEKYRWTKWICEQTVNSTRSLRQMLESGWKKPFLIVGIGSSAREFMYNAYTQVNRMSKNNHSNAGYRVRFEGWFCFMVGFFLFFSCYCFDQRANFRKGKSKFQKVNDLLPA